MADLGAPQLPRDPHRLPERGEWFATDATRHLLDRPRFCPMCGADLDQGLTTEYWSGDERVFLTWCAACSWLGNVVRFDHVAIEERADG
jgi:hypothetical protein